MESSQRKKLIVFLTAVCAVLSAVTIVFFSFRAETGYALSATIVIILSLLPFVAGFEAGKQKARDIVPIAVMAALAVVGRLAFAAIPSFKPMTAIVIIAGVVFGPQAGFLTGAVSALVSNFFFGQGLWTPWQMFAWGLCGLAAGLIGKTRLGKNRIFLSFFGFVSGYLFGIIMNIWHIIGFVRPVTRASVIAVMVASFSFDITHAVSTTIFLLLLGKVWIVKLERIKVKFGILQQYGNSTLVEDAN